MDIEETKNEIIKKGPWKPEEDLLLKSYIETHGEGKWTTVSKRSGLMRGAKSCRMRWKNHLRPNIKRGQISEDEEDLIIRMHKLLGNRWSLIAGRLPGRTDNEVKNYWNTHISKRLLHQCQSTIGSSDCKKIRRVLSHTTMDTHSTSTGTTTRDETKINGSSDEGGIINIIQNADDYQTQLLTYSNSRTRNDSKIDGSGEGQGDASLDNAQPTYASTGSTSQDDKIINRTDEAGGSVEQSTDLPDVSMDEDAMRRSEDDILSWWLSDETTFYVPFLPSTLDFSVLSFESSFDQHSLEECWNNKYQSWF